MITVYFDGSYGPKSPYGTAAWGFVVKQDEATVHAAYGRTGSGMGFSSNCAEFDGLYQAMSYVHQTYPDQPVTFHGDSTLVINLMNSVAKAKKGLYIPYYEKSAALAAPYIRRQQWLFEYVPRAMNSEADELSQYLRCKPNKGERSETIRSINEDEDRNGFDKEARAS